MTSILWLCLASFFLSGPVSAASFSPAQFPGRFILAALFGTGVVLALVLLRLYLGWVYIRDRLSRETVLYEETGWYDGQLWVKPLEEQVKDRLIVTYEVQPALQRLKRTFGLMGLLLFGGCIAWSWL